MSDAATERITLKPCPFCGGPAGIRMVPHNEHDENSGAYYVECDGCGATGRLRWSLKEDARPLLADWWNARAAEGGSSQE
jgi:Lar family restriction alleviation protein